MTADLFAGISVPDYATALGWYEQFMGTAPAFCPNEIEAVWQVTEHGYLYIQHRPEHAGHALITLFVPDLDERVAAIAKRGIRPAQQEVLDNGVRKVTYQDPDGNVIAFGGAPPEQG